MSFLLARGSQHSLKVSSLFSTTANLPPKTKYIKPCKLANKLTRSKTLSNLKHIKNTPSLIVKLASKTHPKILPKNNSPTFFPLTSSQIKKLAVHSMSTQVPKTLAPSQQAVNSIKSNLEKWTTTLPNWHNSISAHKICQFCASIKFLVCASNKLSPKWPHTKRPNQVSIERAFIEISSNFT